LSRPQYKGGQTLALSKTSASHFTHDQGSKINVIVTLTKLSERTLHRLTFGQVSGLQQEGTRLAVEYYGHDYVADAQRWGLQVGAAALQIVGGVIDIGAGIVLTLGSSGIGIIGGVGLMAIGVDQLIAGVYNLTSGTNGPSVLEYGSERAAVGLGASQGTAQIVGGLTPAVLSLGIGSVWAGSGRALSTIKLSPKNLEDSLQTTAMMFRSFGPELLGAGGNPKLTRWIVSMNAVKHTDVSKRVFELVRRRNLEVKFEDLGSTSIRGGLQGNVVIINKNLSVAEQLRTLVHEGSHFLDTARGGFLNGRSLRTGFEDFQTEIYALMHADEFAKLNKFPRDLLPGDKPWRTIIEILEDNKYGPLVPVEAGPVPRVYHAIRQKLINWARANWGDA
jgi:hypothetical protein